MRTRFKTPGAHSSNKRRRRDRRASPRRSQLRVESLEDRRLMAGDVTASISGTTLYITGDVASNHIEVAPAPGGGVKIQNTEAHNPLIPAGIATRTGIFYFDSYYTLINGAHSDTITGQFNHITISMGSGDDTVKMRDLDIPWDATIRLGDGADTAEVRNMSVGDDLRIYADGTGGYGRDVIKVFDSEIGAVATDGDLAIYGTNSAETVYVSNVEVNDDLSLTLTKAGESDRAYVYNNTDVEGNSSGGLARIDSNYLYLNGLEVDGDGDFRQVGTLYAYDSTFYDDLWVDGTNSGDMMILSGLAVVDDTEIDGKGGDDTIRAYGSQGYLMRGGAGNDRLEGGSGNDILHGDLGDDVLLGRAGVDQLFGGGDDDWLEAGTIDEIAEGGSGSDWNAHRWVIDGQSATDVNQNSSSRCVILAAMAGAVDRGFDLASRITYLGNFRYNVKLFDPAINSWADVEVEFDGTPALRDNSSLADTSPTDFANGVGEMWTVLFQRAYSQHFYNIDPTDGEAMGSLPGESSHARAIQSVTGWNASQVDWWLPVAGYLKTDQTLFNELAEAVNNGEVITVGGTGHAYYVKDVFTENGDLKVRLYNPWGTDAVHTPNSANPAAAGLKFEADGSSDGMITMLISDMRANFNRYFRSNH